MTKTTKVFMLTFYSGNNLTFGKISIGFVLCWTMVLTGMIYTVCNVEKAHTLYIETHLLAYLLTGRGKVIGNVHRLRRLFTTAYMGIPRPIGLYRRCSD